MTADRRRRVIELIHGAAGSGRVRDLGRAEFFVRCEAPDRPSAHEIGKLGGWSALRAEAAELLDGEVLPPLEPVPARHRVRGVSSLIDADGRLRAQWVKTLSVSESREEVLARLLRELPATVPVRETPAPVPAGPHQEDLLAVYPLGDPHIGCMAWQAESGADFDLKIAERLMVAAIRDLVLRGPPAARAIVAPLGDTFHFDNLAHHTSGGNHALDTDGRTAKVLQVGMRTITTMIDAALEHHRDVTVDPQAGNHDGFAAIMLAIGLDAYYRNEPRVTVLIDPASRHYHRFGKVLIGTVHGDKTKPDDLPEIMAAERAADWGQTAHRFWLCGHIHHITVREYRGCKVETFRTLAARDSWHAGKGYQSGRDMHRITYHREHGEVSREIVNVGMLESAA